MNQTVKVVQQQIRDLGGGQTAELLNKIFGDEMNNPFGEDFDVDQFFKELLDQHNETEGRRFRKGKIKPLWDGTGSNPVGYNVIPALNPNGVCSSMCLTIVSRGFSRGSLGRRIPPGFTEALLLQCDYWFACMKINQENLFLTPDWDQVTFENHFKPVIDSYCNNHGKKVFIVEVAKTGLMLRYPY